MITSPTLHFVGRDPTRFVQHYLLTQHLQTPTPFNCFIPSYEKRPLTRWEFVKFSFQTKSWAEVAKVVVKIALALGTAAAAFAKALQLYQNPVTAIDSNLAVGLALAAGVLLIASFPRSPKDLFFHTVQFQKFSLGAAAEAKDPITFETLTEQTATVKIGEEIFEISNAFFTIFTKHSTDDGKIPHPLENRSLTGAEEYAFFTTLSLYLAIPQEELRSCFAYDQNEIDAIALARYRNIWQFEFARELIRDSIKPLLQVRLRLQKLQKLLPEEIIAVQLKWVEEKQQVEFPRISFAERG